MVTFTLFSLVLYPTCSMKSGKPSSYAVAMIYHEICSPLMETAELFCFYQVILFAHNAIHGIMENIIDGEMQGKFSSYLAVNSSVISRLSSVMQLESCCCLERSRYLDPKTRFVFLRVTKTTAALMFHPSALPELTTANSKQAWAILSCLPDTPAYYYIASTDRFFF